MDAGDPEQLLRRWQEEDDPDALDALLRLEMAALKAMVRSRRPGGPERPSLGTTDAVQEAVLGLLKVASPPHFDSPGALRTYLWLSAHRLLRRRLERRGRPFVALDAATTAGFADALAITPSTDAVEREDRDLALQLALGLLRPPDRRVLEIVYLEQRDLASAARELAVSHDAAKMRLMRARRALAEKLADWNELIG